MPTSARAVIAAVPWVIAASAVTGRSDAQQARDAFKAQPAAGQAAIVAFLKSLRTFSPRLR
jgi:hypothetical protein